MNTSGLQEMIERFLDGDLPENERQAFEARMAADADLRATVEWHRRLHEEFEDAEKLKLRDTMAEIIRDTPVPMGPSVWLRRIGLTLGLVLAGWLVWKWFNSPASPPPVVREQQTPIAVPDTPAQTSPAQEDKQPKTMAKSEPSAFVPNRIFEDRIGSALRANETTVQMERPRPDETFRLENGQVTISFRGTATALSGHSSLTLNLYDNRSDGAHPITGFQPAIVRGNDGATLFSSEQRLQLQPGLYYYTLERTSDGDLIYVGKFRVTGR